VWSGTASWSQRAERLRQEHQQLDAGMAAVQAALQQQAGTPLAPDCDGALEVLLSQLGGTPGEVTASDGGLLVRLQGGSGSSRQRWFDPAAYGLCGADTALPPAAEPPIPSDGAITGSDGGLTGSEGPGHGVP
jgi:hypothetical protein